MGFGALLIVKVNSLTLNFVGYIYNYVSIVKK